MSDVVVEVVVVELVGAVFFQRTDVVVEGAAVVVVLVDAVFFLGTDSPARSVPYLKECVIIANV